MTEAMREKMSARRVLAVLIGLLVTVLALQGLASVKPGGFEAFAQTTPTAPTIKLINPDSTTSNEISAKSDGADNTYHLVAWVANPPANAVVQFKYTPDGTNQPELSITCADTGTQNARQATADTYECDWNLAGVSAGGGTLRAQLYSSTGKVAEDEEAVEVDPDGQTVELIYPAQGQSVGFYKGPDGIASGMIDVTTSAPGTPAGDEGTQRVTVYYSMSAPGAEPVFEECGTEDVTGGVRESIRCDVGPDNTSTAANEADISRITAIAATTGDTDEDVATSPGNPCTPPALECDVPDIDSADAHRASGYEQDPAAISVTPQTHQATAGRCSQIITAVVTDANARPVVGVNVDVHAAGPTDNLFFDDDDSTTPNTSRHKAPENHPTEASANCETPADQPPNFAGTQGDHDRVEADLKHIESTDATGTNDEGKFTFQLFSVDAGGTQITVWADEDGDDVFCQNEASGIASIGWNQTPPSPTGAEAAQPCATPTGSPTGTPTPAASNTTARPTNTATSTGPTTARTVTMSVDKGSVVAGRQVTFSGQILSGDRTCTDNEFVQIRRRVFGTTTFQDMLTTASDAQGRFTFTRRVTQSADYVAVATAHDNCREATSGEVSVLVKVKLAIIASDTTPSRGDRVRIKSAVTPQHDGTKLILQRKKGKRWVKVDAKNLNRRSRAQFVITANFGSRTFRTLWRSQDAEHETNKSRGITIRT